MLCSLFTLKVFIELTGACYQVFLCSTVDSESSVQTSRTHKLPYLLNRPYTSSSHGSFFSERLWLFEHVAGWNVSGKQLVVTKTITAEREPHFGGLLSHSRRFLDQSWLDVGAVTLYFQSNNPRASFSLEYHRVHWMQGFPSKSFMLHGIWLSMAASKGWPQIANKTLCLHKFRTTDLLSETESRKLEIASHFGECGRPLPSPVGPV